MLNGDSPGISPYGSGTPNVARLHNFFLGGKDHTDADEAVARRVLNAAPDIPQTMLENREFLRRALGHLIVRAGMQQFIDVGPGFPLGGLPGDPSRQHHVHHIAQRLDACRVVYVDNDPVVVAHAGALLAHPAKHTAAVFGDLRQPSAVLASPELARLIDLDQPVCLVLSLLLHFIPDTGEPYEVVAAYRDRLPSGSYLIVSHLTCDGRDDDAIKTITDAYSNANAPMVIRTRAEISRLFAGLELIPPGLVHATQWRPSRLEADYGNADAGGTRWVYVGVAAKP